MRIAPDTVKLLQLAERWLRWRVAKVCPAVLLTRCLGRSR